MRKTVFRAIACLLCMALLAGLPACSLIKNIKENAEKAREAAILDTPADTLAAFNRFLENTVDSGYTVKEDVSFSVKNARAEGDGENAGVERLNAAAKQLTGLIMQNKPGSSSRDVTGAAFTDTLLREFAAEHMVSFTAERNIGTEKELDEKGNEAQDENGNAVTREYVRDNILKLAFLYYQDAPAGQEGETDAAQREIADAALIESVFGAPHDRESILAEFDCLKDYLQIDDYTFEYTDCAVQSELDLETETVKTVRFEKNLQVTAAVTGAGSLAELGSFRVCFDVNEVTAYGFEAPKDAAA